MAHPIFAATVLFSGLILHYETNSATHQKTAYLVKAPNHVTPRILVPVGDFDSASGLTSTTTNGVMKFNLPAGKQYVIVPMDTTNKVTVMSDFDNRVPHLPKILSANVNVHADVVAGKNHNSHATISYSDGTLSTQRCFEDAAMFSPHIMTEQCLAEKVKLEITTNKNWEIHEVGNPTNKIVLKPNGIATIENAAPPSSVHTQHQKHYALLLDTSVSVTVDDIILGNKCDQDKCTIIIPKPPAVTTRSRKDHGGGHPVPALMHEPLVECSNSQWP